MKSKGHAVFGEENESGVFMEDYQEFGDKLRGLHPTNYHTALASYYADALTGWALGGISLTMLLFSIFSVI